MSSSSDHVARNIEAWTRSNAEYTDGDAATQWASEEIRWGVFGIADTEVGALGDVAGLDVCDLGCGTGYFCAWLARRGARPVGVDVTPAQLETARRMQAESGVDFPLIEASAEQVPLPDSSFDFVLSEYGASTWCDPKLWIPEAARLLRPGGRLVFLHTTPLLSICWPEVSPGLPGRELLRPYFGLHRLEWQGETGVEFQLTHGEWIDVLAANGFTVDRLLELRPPADASAHAYYEDFSPEWSRSWPAEEIWVATRA